MADSILRLRIESNEYDAKLKKAAEGIQQLAKSCHDAGGVLNVLEDENRDYIKSLGNMATAAHTTKGKLREMTSAFTEIKSVYNSLTTEEKNGVSRLPCASENMLNVSLTPVRLDTSMAAWLIR